MSDPIVKFFHDTYRTNEFIPLHAPQFSGNEKTYVLESIDSTFVSSVGKFVDDFEARIEDFTGTAKAIATVNGTAALHTALHLAGINPGDMVITQALTFVATCNALHHMGAEPIFIDISETSLSLCPKALARFLNEHAELTEDGCRYKSTQQRIKAIIPMHTFGHPAEMDELLAICGHWNIFLIEDAAESLGSFYKEKHTGTLGDFGAISFNGNKIITTGGGGMLLCKDKDSGNKAKHITTTAKVPHPYEYFHDEAGFNYRMPNINAALGCAQMEVIENYLKAKRQLAMHYQEFFSGSEYTFFTEPKYAQSNYWLNAVICKDRIARDKLLKKTNDAGVMTRPVWQLMHRLPMFSQSVRDELKVSQWLEQRIVNIPSTPLLGGI